MTNMADSSKGKQEFFKHHMWAFLGGIIGIVIIVLIATLLGTRQAPESAPSIDEDTIFSAELSTLYSAFSAQCPEISACSPGVISRYVSGNMRAGVPIGEIRHIDEILSRVSSLLQSQKADYKNPHTFWESDSVILLGVWLDIVEAEEWLEFLTSINPSEFCSEVYQAEPDKPLEFNAFYVPLHSLNVYTARCILKFTEPISTILIYEGNDFPQIENLQVYGLDSDAIKKRFCVDLSPLIEEENFSFLTGTGLAYVKKRLLCNEPLLEHEVQAIMAALELEPETEKQAFYQRVYSNLI
jgi:hypothetical protein